MSYFMGYFMSYFVSYLTINIQRSTSTNFY